MYWLFIDLTWTPVITDTSWSNWQGPSPCCMSLQNPTCKLESKRPQVSGWTRITSHGLTDCVDMLPCRDVILVRISLPWGAVRGGFLPTQLKLFKDVQIPDVFKVCRNTAGRTTWTVTDICQTQPTFIVIVFPLGLPVTCGLLHNDCLKVSTITGMFSKCGTCPDKVNSPVWSVQVKSNYVCIVKTPSKTELTVQIKREISDWGTTCSLKKTQTISSSIGEGKSKIPNSTSHHHVREGGNQTAIFLVSGFCTLKTKLCLLVSEALLLQPKSEYQRKQSGWKVAAFHKTKFYILRQYGGKYTRQ